MFEKASRLKLRIETNKGFLSAEDLWDLDLYDLNGIAKGLNRELKSLEEDDFLGETNPQDAITKLQFDIVLHILNKKKDEIKASKEAMEKKIEKQKILEILAKKRDEGLESLSEDELLAKLEEIG